MFLLKNSLTADICFSINYNLNKPADAYLQVQKKSGNFIYKYNVLFKINAFLNIYVRK